MRPYDTCSKWSHIFQCQYEYSLIIWTYTIAEFHCMPCALLWSFIIDTTLFHTWMTDEVSSDIVVSPHGFPYNSNCVIKNYNTHTHTHTILSAPSFISWLLLVFQLKFSIRNFFNGRSSTRNVNLKWTPIVKWS